MPARRKFIKGAGAEFGQVSEIVGRLAVPHPSIGFRLTHNGRQVLELPAVADVEERLPGMPTQW